MSIQSENSSIQYTGNNSVSTPYPIPFYFFQESDINVVLTNPDGTEAALNVAGYSVSGAGSRHGGNLTTAVPYGSDYKITILRDLPVTQPGHYLENQEFPAAAHEGALDRLAMLVQQLKRGLRRCLRVTEAAGDLNEIPIAEAPQNRLLGFDHGSNVTLFNNAEILALLETEGTLFDKATLYWSDNAARAATIPHFTGQAGIQADNSTFWISTGTNAGDWVEHRHTGIATEEIQHGAITTAKLANQSATTSKISDNAITTVKLQDTSVTTPKLADNDITAAKLAPALWRSYVKISDQKTTGTDGQSLTSGGWNIRDINTENFDDDSLVAIDTTTYDRFTLQAGTYEMLGFIPGYSAGLSKARLVNVTDSNTVLLISTMSNSYISHCAWNVLSGKFTLTDPKVLKVEQYTSTVGGKGGKAIAGVIPVYTVLQFWRVG